VGPDQFGGVALTVLLLAAMMVRHFNTTNVYALFCFGHERRLALTGLADGLVTLVATVVLVKTMGVLGAPLGAIAGVLLVGAPLNLAALSRETAVERGRLITILGPWFWRFAVVAMAATAAGAWFRPPTFAWLALLGAAAGGLYLAVVMAPLLRSPAGAYLRPLLQRIPGVRPGSDRGQTGVRPGSDTGAMAGRPDLKTQPQIGA
jgi:hypothetical protein